MPNGYYWPEAVIRYPNRHIAQVMSENTNESNSPEEISRKVKCFWKRDELVFYILVLLAWFAVLAITFRFKFGTLATLVVCLFTWWIVLISCWIHPAFCWFEVEREWLRKSRSGEDKIVQRIALLVAYWPLVVS